MTVMPRAKVPYDLKQGQSRHFHCLPPRLSLEVIVQKSTGSTVVDSESNRPPPPLVFVNGSYHAAWCWVEHWLPFFSGRGYDCFAVSLLGQGESDAPPAGVAGFLERQMASCQNLLELCLSDLFLLLLTAALCGFIYFPNPIAAFMVTRSLANKAFQTSLPLGKETFFSATMGDDVIRCYQELMKESSQIPLFNLRNCQFNCWS